MVMVKIHKMIQRGFDTKFLGIKMPRRSRFHLDCKSANSSHVGIPLSDHALELNRLLNIGLLFKGHSEGEEKVTEDPVGL
jgi:hypothetical protein